MYFIHKSHMKPYLGHHKTKCVDTQQTSKQNTSYTSCSTWNDSKRCRIWNW